LTKNQQPANFVAELKREKDKKGFKFGRLTKPKEFNFTERRGDTEDTEEINLQKSGMK
jgi:hypothetical protein